MAAKETRAEELRRLMDNNMRELQKRKESEVGVLSEAVDQSEGE